jgi:hypothetical protein
MNGYFAARLRRGQLLDFYFEFMVAVLVCAVTLMHHSVHGSHASAHGMADFIIVVSSDDDHHAGYHLFAEKVNRKLRAGYQLHGQPFNVNQTLCQAMFRPAGAPVAGETAMFVKPSSGYH